MTEVVDVFFARYCAGGHRNSDLEREYMQTYHALDVSLPRIRRLPDSKAVRASTLFTEAEKKTSVMYNEALPRARFRDAVYVRLFRALAAAGIDFIHSDADAFFLRDLRPWLKQHGGYDLLCSQDCASPPGTAGVTASCSAPGCSSAAPTNAPAGCGPRFRRAATCAPATSGT